MMKLLSGEWYAAERENKTLRDKHRKQFWSEVGITPAKDTAEINIGPESRVPTLMGLIEQTLNGKEGDGELKSITSQAANVLSEFAYGSFTHGPNFSNSMEAVSPKALREYFLTDTDTAYEHSELDS